MKPVVVPEGMAVMPPGPGLAAVLGGIELGRVPNDRMLEVLAAQHRQLNHEQARMAATLAEIGRCEAVSAPGAVARLARPGRYAAEESRAALRWTRSAAEQEHDLAEVVVVAMPLVFRAWWAGALDRPRVRVFHRCLCGLDAEPVARICAVAVPLAPRRTTGQLAVLLRKMVIAVDPEAANRWYRKGIRGRDVVAYPAPDGTITISAHGLPADEAEAACVRIERLADAAKRAGHPGRIGQIRCDLFLGLLDGRFTGMTTAQVIAALLAQAGAAPAGAAPAGGDQAGGDQAGGDQAGGDQAGGDQAAAEPEGDTDTSDGEGGEGSRQPDDGPSEPDGPSGPSGPVPSAVPEDEPRDDRRGIEIRIAPSTLLGRDEHPAEIPGLGPLVAPAARVRVARQHRAQWRFAVTDPDGQLLSEGLTRRRPTGIRHAPGPPGGTVELHVPLTLLQELTADTSDGAGEWAGVIADIAAQHARRHEHLRDLDNHPDARLPGAALRRHTEIRDRTCTHPGCRRPAWRRDQDHTLNRAHGGTTVRANLGPTCPHDHRVKHDAGWTVQQPEPGTFLWHSPLGGVYRSRGEFLDPPMPDPTTAPDAAGNDDQEDHYRYDEGPILPRPRPRPEATTPRAPPAPSDPDEPAPF